MRSQVKPQTAACRQQSTDLPDLRSHCSPATPADVYKREDRCR